MRQRLGRPHRLVSSIAMLVIVSSLTIATAPVSQAVNIAQGAIVNPNPENWTPNVLDGQVNSIVQIGNEIYAAGQFTQVQAASGGTIYSRTNIFAFNATTGAIDTTFAPTLDDMVRALAVAPDGNLFVAGNFNAVNGDTTIKKLVKLNPTTGQRITAFSANANGQVWDLAVSGTRLFVGGRFTAIKNVARDRLAALNTTTGAVDLNVNFTITDPHTSTSVPWVYKLDVSPNGTKLVIIGNFMTVNGQSRPQVAMIDLGPTSAVLSNWQTDLYAPACFSWAFDTYMRDIDFSPDGSYFVIGATGGPNVGTLCDTDVRWNTNATGSGLQPAWVDVTGGDTISAIAVTGAAVYSGGHQRWQNNYYGTDSPGPGAVDRPGIAALDPVNGVPFSWNPTKDRGKGVFALYSTSAGLWMGSDTDHTAGELRKKIAFFPIAGGKTPPSTDPYTLPGDLYNVPISSCNGVDPSILYRVNAGGPKVGSVDCGPDWVADDSDGAPGAAYRDNGSNSVPSWGQQFTVDNTVPATTPSTIFDSERWDPGDPPEMQWNFPVPSGTHLEVRLYLINQCGCTSGVGNRVFNVAIDGNTVLNNYDIVADVGDRVGTMRAFPITSDGDGVNIDFSHVTENSLINGIEIVNTDIPPMPPPGAINFLSRRTFDGGTNLGTTSNLNTPSTDWSTTRGIFALQGTLYNGSTDGNFYARTFNGTNVGPAQQINLNGLTDFPVQSLTGLFYANGGIYYTVKGDPQMYYRYFTPESQIVGSYRFPVTASCPTPDTSILYRVNTGGPEVGAVDCGPNWVADDSDGAPGAAYRDNGSNSVPSWGQQFTVDNTVPATTPSTIFDSERWDPGDPPEMQWNFPVPSGTHLEVRLYLINQCGCTSGVGNRVFNVAIDGNTVLNNYDIVADVGDRVGTMRAFPITSDGDGVNIDFSHVTENSLINGIEIVNTDIPPVPASPVDWSDVSGMTLANGKLYFARTNGNLYSMNFANGAPVRGTDALVSPKSDGYDWASNGLFAFTHITVDTDPPTAPGKPTGSSPVTGTITINWPASTDASPPITYRIYRDGNQVGTTTSTSFTDTDPVNLTAGSSHTYRVDAVDSLNNPPSQLSPVSDPIVVASAIFSDDFSSGNLTNWTSQTRLTIDNSTGGVAAPSARAQTSSQTAFASKTLSGTFSNVCLSANVNVAVRDSVSTTLIRVRTAGNAALVRVFVNPAGILYLRSDASGTQIYSGVNLGTGWHKLELCGTVGVSGTWDLYRDGSKATTLVANTGTTPVGRVEIGNAQAVTATINFDDVVVDQTPGG